MERIIYVIPYTSIIEQNASVFRDILGNDCVLEHHSNFRFTDDGDDARTFEQYRLRLSTENWDAPIVVTTNVQFFESLFAAQSSRCRKLHNIANSVVILDEAQMLPTAYLRPCLLALSELVTSYRTSIVLCTATQPAIKSYLPSHLTAIELAPDPPRLYEALKRVRVRKLGNLDDEALANRIAEHEQVLCIVNTRSHAAKLYRTVGEREVEGVYHLSARMYPEHRSRKLREIRAALSAGELCRVVSTQLIEAGVDVDFPVVYRAMAGVDSIAQAAGRCNREGKLDSGEVYVYRPEQHGQPRGWLRETAAVAEMVMRTHDDPLSLDAVELYFTRLYDVEGERLDAKGIVRNLEENAKQLGFPFRWVDREFRIIEHEMIPIIIPLDPECDELVKQARWGGPSTGLSRAFQPYTVQVYHHEYITLAKNGVLEMVAGQYLVLRDLSIYKEDIGLDFETSVGVDDVLIF
jgi:CRISPR-associated endonuclease/helicase Cas3